MALSLAERLKQVGEALYGPEWQRAVARDLGPLHPRGGRDHLDDRLVRRWISGERLIAAWVSDALPELIQKGVDRRHAEIANLKSLSKQISLAQN